MRDWLQFSLLDMTPYDRDGWLWLIENYQQDYPYLPVFSLLHSGLLVLLIFRPVSHAPRFALGLLALNWFWCGWVFQMQYHASMNWAATQIGWVFVGQAILLMLPAILGKSLAWKLIDWRYDWLVFLVLMLQMLYPLIGWFEGRTIHQLEWPGFMAAPLTLATLGVSMLLKSYVRWVLLLIPLLWSLVSAAFMLKLGLFEPYVTGLALFVLFIAVLYGRVNRTVPLCAANHGMKR